MVGPGTGVAPFRSYIHERDAEGSAHANNLHLYFGCRNQNGDFHFSEEWLTLQRTNKLSLYCAFSRDQEEKVYVCFSYVLKTLVNLPAGNVCYNFYCVLQLCATHHTEEC